MLVSFVIPTRNQAEFIRRCIDGCLAQDIPDREVVVVDGASTDGTQAILESYGDRIRWISEPDRGHPDALNKGIAMAQGELIAWINSDDYYPHEHVLSRVLKEFTEAGELEIVYGDGRMVDLQGEPIRTHRGRRLRNSKEILLLPSSFVMQPAVFFRKHLYQQVGGAGVKFRIAPDYELWLRMFPAAKATRYVPEVFACATYHAEATSVRSMLPMVHATRRIKQLHRPDFKLGPLDVARLWAGIAALYAYWAAVKLGLKRFS